ncbi:sugar MFS transporter [Kutzneria buriramensis]|uniref:Fucose permease n=1 Tax=Kutzneria buriramensis TaxID=1045776 RepID=A0A3E0I249_9PSEU|nr:MFS transporter [Kutzneria buriramensis]REH52255.1 fucose permease [Kutzneria buriramensis]
MLVLSCLAYLGVALPGATLGLLWPSMAADLREPVGALGFVLVAGVATNTLSSLVAGRLRTPPRVLLAAGMAAIGVALVLEALAPALWVIVIGSAIFSLGFGAVDAVLNAHAAGHFGPRDITWMHAAYGIGAALGPLLVTGLREGVGWRGAMVALACPVAVVAVIVATRWRDKEKPRPARGGRGLLVAVAFSAVESGIEAAAGVWGFLYLTSARGLPAVTAGVAVSAYWATMVVGRGVLGVLAGRLGPRRILAAAMASVPLGALLMSLPGQFPAVAGLMVVGLATAPVFPLLALVTADRAAVSAQVAASAIGGAGLPAGIGLVIGAAGAWTLGPSLLVLSLAMYGISRAWGPTRRTPRP